MTQYVCDRCRKIISNRKDFYKVTAVSLEEYTVRFPTSKASSDLCASCLMLLITFLKPLPKPTK